MKLVLMIEFVSAFVAGMFLLRHITPQYHRGFSSRKPIICG
jgi:quinol-cytochrome oxidoreductase complex cytochrome b subunit